VLGKERWKRNADWCGDVLINIGQEKDEARMKLLNRSPRENRELYKQRKKETYILYRRKERKKINKQIVDIQSQDSNKEDGKFYKEVKE
jgi:hypothetical protein